MFIMRTLAYSWISSAFLVSSLPACGRAAELPSARQASAGKPDNAGIRFNSRKRSSGWVKFDLYSKSRIMFPVVVNGRTVTAMLDSGASSTVLDKSFSEGLGLTTVDHLIGEAVGGKTDYSTVKGVSLQLGRMRWNGEAVAIDLSFVSQRVGRPLPILLGGELFRKLVVDIDFARHRIAFRDPADFVAPASAYSAPLTPAGDNQSITVSVEGRPANLVLDLGNPGNLILSPHFWARPGFMGTRKTSTGISGGAGGTREQRVTMVGLVTIGKSDFHEIPAQLWDVDSQVGTQDPSSDGNIGIGILRRFHLIVDFPHHRVLLAPPIDHGTPFTIDHSGLRLKSSPAGKVVVYVAAASPAAKAGLIPGDVIASVNGVRQTLTTNDEWRFGPIPGRIKLHLLSGRDIVMELARYF
ncbi:PDZ domain-containing protein [Sphingomonas sp. OK281]|nr:PDZ domain-containing protein [Sphingomonas sp. OK281]